jgi:hypothetical protein
MQFCKRSGINSLGMNARMSNTGPSRNRHDFAGADGYKAGWLHSGTV